MYTAGGYGNFNCTYVLTLELAAHQAWVGAFFFKAIQFMLGEQTHNILESLNGEIKIVYTGFASLDTFFSECFTVLRVLLG